MLNSGEARSAAIAPVPTRVKSADRTVEILELLAESPRRMSLAELQRALGVPKSSLHALLRTLTARGWVEPDVHRVAYGIGPRALRVGVAFLDKDPVVQAATRPMAELRAALDETVHLARLDGAEVLYLASRESQHQIRVISRIGKRLPAHATALGKAMLASLPWDDVDAMLPEQLDALTPLTVTDRAELHDELETIRARGWAVEKGQSTLGLVCYAVALPSIEPDAVNALSCSLPDSRDSDEHGREIVDGLVQCAQELVAGVVRLEC